MSTRFSRSSVLATGLVVASVVVAAGQQGTVGNGIRQFVSVNAPVVAMTHVRVIDGTGAPAREDQTLVIRDGNIVALGSRRVRRRRRGRDRRSTAPARA